MHSSTLFQIAAVAMSVSATPIEKRQNTLAVFKTYAAPSDCSTSPSDDMYDSIVIANTNDAATRECHRFTDNRGWGGVKLEADYMQAGYNFTTYAFKSENCDPESERASLSDRICQGGGEGEYLSWQVLLW